MKVERGESMYTTPSFMLCNGRGIQLSLPKNKKSLD